MRFAITSMATSSESVDGSVRGEERSIIGDLRLLRSAFEGLDTTMCEGPGLGKDVEGKMKVMKTCVEKVEYSCYSKIVRGSERPSGWVPDAPVVESY